ncbi:hypothetical protein QOV31_005210 (plasmid) [Agrobacterium fabrum]|uniref:hypothetical protein n=2 Tax=Rhizobiaceae TaxID=82115 RepID=UPI000A73DD3F|nr:hypothetical protein [Rhizobium rhizogenes]WJK78325.1 hypothetical protein QOV31_005210 [Agrobacterium fabrum]NTF72620.1 hypothetical protein [Rhizobium rhizogenes]NTI85333.1 hypothetical protein [Rhizobium rhizogenes]NTJ27516.1 hypothetical protein [Rhizobium rhizogenes]QUE84967.1 hypothetical protein EML492_32870 [Rhizobium rhizogenes]
MPPKLNSAPHGDGHPVMQCQMLEIVDQARDRDMTGKMGANMVPFLMTDLADQPPDDLASTQAMILAGHATCHQA